MTGYWPPTDTGGSVRPGMLKDWKPMKRNYRGYDVLAISPGFPAVEPPTGWGVGSPPLPVEYYGTSRDFWAIMLKRKPIAIMSFGLDPLGNKNWELEKAARNLAQADWDLDALSHRPHPGGSAADFSPYRNDPDNPPVAPYPPDPTRAADAQLASNLPNEAIEAAIDDAFTDQQIDPFIDESGDVGDYLCEYMAYHVAWYREYINAKYPNDESKKCQFSGFAHVGGQVSVSHAKQAVKIQLDVLIDELEKE